MALQVTTQAGRLLRGDDALAHEGEAAQFDAAGNVIAAATEHGLQLLLRELGRHYGSDAQQEAGQTIDQFLELRRGRLSLLEYLTEHEYTLEEARYAANFELNGVGRSWFLLKHAHLDRARHDQLLLMVNNDLSRYDELKMHLERMAKATQPIGLPGPSGYYGEEADEEYPDHAYWFYDDHAWVWWTSDDGEDWWPLSYDDDFEEESDANEGGLESLPALLGKGGKGKGKRKGKGGKGKGKGFGGKGAPGKGTMQGCSHCGSPNHRSDDCPWQNGKGKGKGKGGKKGFGGKGKSKGKGKRGKKGRRFWADEGDDWSWQGGWQNDWQGGWQQDDWQEESGGIAQEGAYGSVGGVGLTGEVPRRTLLVRHGVTMTMSSDAEDQAPNTPTHQQHLSSDSYEFVPAGTQTTTLLALPAPTDDDEQHSQERQHINTSINDESIDNMLSRMIVTRNRTDKRREPKTEQKSMIDNLSTLPTIDRLKPEPIARALQFGNEPSSTTPTTPAKKKSGVCDTLGTLPPQRRRTTPLG